MSIYEYSSVCKKRDFVVYNYMMSERKGQEYILQVSHTCEIRKICDPATDGRQGAMLEHGRAVKGEKVCWMQEMNMGKRLGGSIMKGGEDDVGGK